MEEESGNETRHEQRRRLPIDHVNGNKHRKIASRTANVRHLGMKPQRHHHHYHYHHRHHHVHVHQNRKLFLYVGWEKEEEKSTRLISRSMKASEESKGTRLSCGAGTNVSFGIILVSRHEVFSAEPRRKLLESRQVQANSGTPFP